jgi:hypothetical protein
MQIHDLDVVIVSFKTPELISLVIQSFRKFKTQEFNLRFIVIENSDFNLIDSINEYIENSDVVINNPINLSFSYAHGSGLEAAKRYLSSSSKYVFTCHSDTCVVSTSFFNELKKCIEEEVWLAGVCQDSHQDRIFALHCSGLLVKSDLYKETSLMPLLPKIDTADLLTVRCRENNLKMKLFKNTYNDPDLVDVCNSPYKELGKSCGVDRCLDSDNNVMFIHQGRGTSKYSNSYHNPQKIMTSKWIELCKSAIERSSL